MMWLAIGASVAGLAALGIWLYLERRRRRLRRRVKRAARRQTPACPIVLLHGVLGFDEIAVGPARRVYFRGIDDTAAKLVVSLHRPRLPATASVARRAAELQRFLEQLDAPRVNVIAHSMGGIDARYALCRLGLGDRIGSLITIGTPHRGTPLADAAVEVFGDRLGLRRLARLLGLDLQAFCDLTCDRMVPFNECFHDRHDVYYGSIVGSVRDPASVTPVLVPFHRYIHKRWGHNDGMVPATSQAWGEVLLEVEADHWAQIGWSRHFDAGDMFEAVFRELRGRGL